MATQTFFWAPWCPLKGARLRGGGAAPAPRCLCGPRLIPGSVLFRPFRNFNLFPPPSPVSPWLFLIRFVVETAPACRETGSRSSPRAAPIGSVYLNPCQPSSGLCFPPFDAPRACRSPPGRPCGSSLTRRPSSPWSPVSTAPASPEAAPWLPLGSASHL